MDPPTVGPSACLHMEPSLDYQSSQEIFEYVPVVSELASIGSQTRTKHAVDKASMDKDWDSKMEDDYEHNNKNKDNGIVESNPKIDPNIFETSIIDPVGSDFSGNIASNRSDGYHLRRSHESTPAKIARLRLEIEQLSIGSDAHTETEAKELKQLLDSKLNLETGIQKNKQKAGMDFYKDLGNEDQIHKGELLHKSGSGDTVPLMHHHYNVLSELEKRVSALERIVGLSAAKSQAPISLRMEDLQRRVTLLTATPKGLEVAILRLKDLVINVDRLKSAGPDLVNKASTNTETKINALYDKIPVINELSETLPYVVSRLETLRKVHADATITTAVVSHAESTLSAMRSELAQWKQSLETLEAKLDEYGTISRKNMSEVEERIRKLQVV